MAEKLRSVSMVGKRTLDSDDKWQIEANAPYDVTMDIIEFISFAKFITLSITIIWHQHIDTDPI